MTEPRQLLDLPVIDPDMVAQSVWRVEAAGSPSYSQPFADAFKEYTEACLALQTLEAAASVAIAASRVARIAVDDAQERRERAAEKVLATADPTRAGGAA